MITLERFRLMEDAIRARGFGATIEWTEGIVPPRDADHFAEEAIYVICNSGMANNVAEKIFQRCCNALRCGQPVAEVYKHPGKITAIEAIWRDRVHLFASYQVAENKVEALRALPWIGEITALHLAKNLGAETAKPDVHMERLARAEDTTTEELCARLARETGYRVGTIDTILWRACAERILLSQTYEREGWNAAFDPHR